MPGSVSVRNRVAPGSADAAVVVNLLVELAAVIRRRSATVLERAHRLPPQTAEIALRLAEAPGGRLEVGELASDTTLTPSGLARALERLQRAGLLTREHEAGEKRHSSARLTLEGSSAMRSALRTHRRECAVVLAPPQGGEGEGLGVLLDRVRRGLEEGAR